MIDLTKTRQILEESQGLVAALDKLDHADDGNNRGPKAEREARVQNSRDLLLLADRLTLAAGLVMNEYWFSRGERDAMNPSRDD